MPIDIERARRDTPGCESVLHFNNAGSSLMPASVLDAQIEHLRLEAKSAAMNPPMQHETRLSVSMMPRLP
jgi:selenocysteine lyase/cysteine desulfurase